MDTFRGIVIVGPLSVMGPGKKCRVGVTRRVGMVRMEQQLVFPSTNPMLGVVGLGTGHPYCLLSADFQARRPSGGGESGEPDPEGDRQLWAPWARHSKQQNL